MKISLFLGLLDSVILDNTELQAIGSCDSILEQDLLKENINKTQIGPRIRKPSAESPENQENGSEKGIRGRRKGLYSPKKIHQNSSNTPPSKPVIAPKPKNLVKSKMPGSPRGTRSTQLRQITKTRLASPPSPKMAQKSR